MKICNASGVGICTRCDGITPKYDNYSCGDICRDKVQNIMNYLESGDIYCFQDGKLYNLTVMDEDIYHMEEVEI